MPELLARNIHWDILLILPSPDPLPPPLHKLVKHQWSIQAGVPSRLLQDYRDKNGNLLRPREEDIPPLTGSLEKGKRMMNPDSAQHLELNPELLSWIEEFTASGTPEGKGAVSMLNLLSFSPGKKGEYLKYGKAFADSAGSRRGGNAKIVGSVIHPPSLPPVSTLEGSEGHSEGSRERGGGKGKVERGDDEGWDEIALAHYPSLWHFADMLASEEYQAVNQRWRVGSLRDTFILCTSEVGLDEGWREGKAKL